MIKNYRPPRLPLKSLDWSLFAPFLGEARERLARYDETIRPLPPAVLEVMKWQESISNLRSQNIETNLEEVLLFSLNKQADEIRAGLLQKVLYAKEALDFAMRWPRTKPLHTPFLCRIHALLKRDAPNQKEIGRLRDRQNWIGEEGCPIEKGYFLPPKPNLVPAYLKNWALYSSSRKELDPLVQLAILFAQFLMIHPFMDGNGRAIRIYAPLFLFRKKLLHHPFFFFSRYFEAHRLLYIQKLFAISEEGDWEGWIIYFLKGIAELAFHWKSEAEELKRIYLEVGDLDLFLHPIRKESSLSLQKKKILIEKPKGIFWFAPLFKAI